MTSDFTYHADGSLHTATDAGGTHERVREKICPPKKSAG